MAPAIELQAHHVLQLAVPASSFGIPYMLVTLAAELVLCGQVMHNNVLYCWIDSADWLHGIEYR